MLLSLPTYGALLAATTAGVASTHVDLLLCSAEETVARFQESAPGVEEIALPQIDFYVEEQPLGLEILTGRDDVLRPIQRRFLSRLSDRQIGGRMFSKKPDDIREELLSGLKFRNPSLEDFLSELKRDVFEMRPLFRKIYHFLFELSCLALAFEKLGEAEETRRVLDLIREAARGLIAEHGDRLPPDWERTEFLFCLQENYSGRLTELVKKTGSYLDVLAFGVHQEDPHVVSVEREFVSAALYGYWEEALGTAGSVFGWDLLRGVEIFFGGDFTFHAERSFRYQVDVVDFDPEIFRLALSVSSTEAEAVGLLKYIYEVARLTSYDFGDSRFSPGSFSYRQLHRLDPQKLRQLVLKLLRCDAFQKQCLFPKTLLTSVFLLHFGLVDEAAQAYGNVFKGDIDVLKMEKGISFLVKKYLSRLGFPFFIDLQMKDWQRDLISVLRVVGFHDLSSEVSFVSLEKILPVHTLDFERVLALKASIYFRLLSLGWIPGTKPEKRAMKEALYEVRQGSPPIVSLPDRRTGIRLLLNGHHRIFALVSLVLDGILPPESLHNIPVLISKTAPKTFLGYLDKVPEGEELEFSSRTLMTPFLRAT